MVRVIRVLKNSFPFDLQAPYPEGRIASLFPPLFVFSCCKLETDSCEVVQYLY